MKTFSVEEKENIEKIINSSKLCYVGMVDDKGSPYVLPMTFGYNDGVVYLHSAQEGKAIRILCKNPKVCIAFCTDPELIWQHPDVACSYRMRAGSALCEGEVVFEEDFIEKEKILHIIMHHYSDKTFTFSVPAVNNVKIWKVAIKSMSAKEFGVMHPGSITHGNMQEGY